MLKSLFIARILVGYIRRVMALLLFLGGAETGLAQQPEYIFKNVSVEEGLSHATAHHIMQDRRGFIWISTRDGLNRYDGQRFKIFKHDPDNPNSLLSNTVWVAHEGPDGLIWIGTSGGGLNVYDPTRDRFYHFLEDDRTPNSISSNTVLTIFEDEAGTIWIGTEGGGLNKVANKYFEDGKLKLKFKSYQPDSTNPQSITNATVMDIEQRAPGFLWIATYGGGVNRFDIEKEVFESDFPLDGSYVMSMALQDDQLWAATKYNGLSLLDIEMKLLKKNFRHGSDAEDSLSSNFVWPLHIDNDGTVWAGTFGGGINRITVDQNSLDNRFSVLPIEKNSKEVNQLADNYVLAIFEDRNGSMWAATNNNGVSIFHQNPFYNRPGFEIQNLALEPKEISFNDFFRDKDGSLWMGTNYGLLLKKANSEQAIRLPVSREAKVVNAIYQFGEQRLLIGTNVGLFEVSMSEPFVHRKVRVSQDRKSTIDRVFDIVQDEKRRIWLSTNSGIWTLDSKLKFSGRIHTRSPGKNSISSENIGRLYLEGDTLWIATSTAGLNKLDINSGEITAFTHQPGDATTIGSNKVLDIIRDQSGTLWAATYGGGLNKLVYQKGKPVFKKYLEKHGLPDNTVKGLAEDKKGHMWITTQDGIAHFDLSKENITPISIPVTYSNLNLNQIFHYQGSQYLITASKGYWYLDISDFPFQKEGAPLRLTNIEVMGRKYRPGIDYSNLPELSLSHDQNFLTFEFTLLDYRSADFASFSYKMEGIDKEWINGGRSNIVHYAALEPGEYVFRVKAVGYDGIPAQNQLAIRASILPPIWDRWWFKFSIVTAVMLMMGFAYRYRVNALLEVERTRRRIAEDLHDEISSTLSSIRFFGSALSKKHPELIKSRNLNLILESSTDAKEKIADIIWSVDPENDDWVNLFSKCRRFASDLLESKNIDYRLDMDTDIDRPLDIELRQHLWLIFKEMVVNTARHSQADKVEVTFGMRGNTLQLIVQDDGVGIADSFEKNPGYGIKNIKKRAGQIGAELRLETDPAIGTRWIMSLDMR